MKSEKRKMKIEKTKQSRTTSLSRLPITRFSFFIFHFSLAFK